MSLSVIDSQVVGESCLGDALNPVNGQVCTLDIKVVGDKFCLTWADLLVKEFGEFKEAQAVYIQLIQGKEHIDFKGLVKITSFWR